MNHSFYTSAPVLGPVYTLQYFDMQNAYNDRVLHTMDVMDEIKKITDGETFYYQYDNPGDTSHCVTAHYNGEEMVIEKDEIRTTLPGSDLLTVVL